MSEPQTAREASSSQPFKRKAHSFSPLTGVCIAIVASICLLFAAHSPILSMVKMWRGEEYGYGWLIAPLAILIFFARLGRVAIVCGSWHGVTCAAIAVALLFFGSFTNSAWFSIYGVIVGLFGLAVSSFGLQSMRLLGGPIFYLFFMIPLPLAAYLTATAGMQLVSSRLGLSLMSFVGVPATLDGNVITLPAGRLEVAEACSGLRYLFPLASFSFMLTLLIQDAAWKKLIIFCSCIPIALFTNSLRIAMIGILVNRYGIEMAHGVQHEIEGFVVFLACITLVISFAAALLRIRPSGSFALIEGVWPQKASLSAAAKWPCTKPLLWSGTILTFGAVVLASLPSYREETPARRPLALFPLQFETWHGIPSILDQDSLVALALTDYTLADYYNKDDKTTPLGLYIAYYASQKFGSQAHSPSLCIPGGGWNIEKQNLQSVSSPGQPGFLVNRVVIEKKGVRQVVYYWFEERGHHLTNEYAIKYYAIIDAFKLHRSDGALVRLSTPLIEGEEIRADERLHTFYAILQSRIHDYVPN